MIKIWAKVMKDNRIIKQVTLLDRDDAMDYSKFFDYMTQICQKLDIDTPIIIKTHIFNYAKFNFVRFTADDFVQKITFDNLWIENINK